MQDMDQDTLGARLRRQRRSLDLTQAQLAEAVGVSPGAITQFERGHRTPLLRTCAAMAERLGVSIDWLVRGTQPPQAGAEAQEAG